MFDIAIMHGWSFVQLEVGNWNIDLTSCLLYLCTAHKCTINKPILGLSYFDDHAVYFPWMISFCNFILYIAYHKVLLLLTGYCIHLCQFCLN